VAVYDERGVRPPPTGALAGSMFDLQRVEVLRGPQGYVCSVVTPQGGLIHYISKQAQRRVGAATFGFSRAATTGALDQRRLP